jgi:hypothetical protein
MGGCTKATAKADVDQVDPVCVKDDKIVVATSLSTKIAGQPTVPKLNVLA